MVGSATIALERSFWQKESKRKASVTLQPTSSDEQVGGVPLFCNSQTAS